MKNMKQINHVFRFKETCGVGAHPIVYLYMYIYAHTYLCVYVFACGCAL